MIVSCPRDGLLSGCQIVSIAVPARTTMPIYQNIKAIANEDGLTLMATDLEVGIRYELRGVEVEETGEAIIPVSRLTSILRESSDKEIRLDADERRTRVNTSTSEYEMPGEDPSSFADIATFEADLAYAELDAGTLQRMIRRTVFAAAKEEGKYAMRGVLWDLDDKIARLVATDGKRLAVSSGACVRHGATEKTTQSHLLPPKAMSLLERILSDGDDAQAVHVALRTNDALFRTERATIYSRLVEGRFPPYRDVFPKKSAIKVPLSAGSFLSAVRQAAIMTDDESKRITFRFTATRVELDAHGAKTGKSKVSMPLEGYKGEEVTINFDPSYLTDMLRVMDPADTIQLEMVDSEKPAVLRVGDDYMYLVVPMV